MKSAYNLRGQPICYDLWVESCECVEVISFSRKKCDLRKHQAAYHIHRQTMVHFGSKMCYYLFQKTEMMKTNMSLCNGSKIYMYINFSKNVFCTFLSQCVYKLEMLYLIRNIEGGKKFPGHPTREKLSGSWAYYFLGVYIPQGPPSILFSAWMIAQTYQIPIP